MPGAGLSHVWAFNPHEKVSMCKPSPLRCRRGHGASEWRGQGRPAHLCDLGSCVLSPRPPCPTSGRLQSQNLNARSPHPTASSPQVQLDAAWSGRGACAGGPPAPHRVEKAQVPVRSSAWDPTWPPTPTEGGNDLSLSLSWNQWTKTLESHLRGHKNIAMRPGFSSIDTHMKLTGNDSCVRTALKPRGTRDPTRVSSRDGRTWAML